jgi:hypothetical protein
MTARFFDRQELGNALNGSIINNTADLRQTLGRLHNRTPFFVELIGDNGFKLLLGIGPALGCAQFSAVNGAAPYTMAVAPNAPDINGYEEFLIGDTASPVATRYCLPYAAVVDIAEYFLESGTPNPAVEWEEI